jgi:polyphosphate kinase
VRSVLDRFLEHSRLVLFESPDSSVLLMGSADLMPRNLDSRVEVVVAVEDQHAQQNRLASRSR